jgi:hypothetical protein
VRLGFGVEGVNGADKQATPIHDSLKYLGTLP